MEIWRLEHRETGHGPWAMGKIPEQITNDILPEVECAKVDCPGFTIGWVCGSPSKEIIEWMFGPILKGLLSIGFEIHKYDIPEGDFIMGKSGKQVVFKKPQKDEEFRFAGFILVDTKLIQQLVN